MRGMCLRPLLYFAWQLSRSTLSAEDKALIHKHLEVCIKDKAYINKLAQLAQVQPDVVGG